MELNGGQELELNIAARVRRCILSFAQMLNFLNSFLINE
jgi:hypothetical protein